MALQTSVFVQAGPGGSAFIAAGEGTGNYGRSVEIQAVADPGYEFVDFMVVETPAVLQQFLLGGFAPDDNGNAICGGQGLVDLNDRSPAYTDGTTIYLDAYGVVKAANGAYGAGDGNYFLIDGGQVIGTYPCLTTQPPTSPPPTSLSFGFCNCGNGCEDGYATTRPCPDTCQPCTIITTRPPISPAPTPSPVPTVPDECNTTLQNCPAGFYCELVEISSSQGAGDITIPIYASLCQPNPTPPPTAPPTTPPPTTPPTPFNIIEDEFSQSPTPPPSTGGGGGGGGGREEDIQI